MHRLVLDGVIVNTCLYMYFYNDLINVTINMTKWQSRVSIPRFKMKELNDERKKNDAEV